MDRWQSFPVSLGGGVIQSMSPLKQANEFPGSLTRGVNIETSRTGGGYRRISGFAEYDSNAVPNTGDLLGVFVFDGAVLACRGNGVYRSTGIGWTQINGSELNESASKYTAFRYNWGIKSIILADGVNRPLRYQNNTLTRLGNAMPAVRAVQGFKRHMFMAADNLLQFSAPNNETDFSPANGAGEVNVGFDILALGVWRDQLYIFGRNQISKIVGNSADDFQLIPVTSRIGIVARDTLQELGGDLLYLADDGIRSIAGTERIGDVEIGSVSDNIYRSVSRLASVYSTGTFSSCVVGEKGQYRLFPALGNEVPVNSYGIIGCMNSGSNGTYYEWFETQGFQVLCADSDYFDSVEIIVHGGFDGRVYRQEIGNSVNGENIVAYMELPYITLGDPRLRSTLYRITAYARIEGLVDIIANIVLNYNEPGTIQPAETRFANAASNFAVYGAAVYGTDRYGANPDITLSQNVVGSGFTHSLIISSDDQKSSYTVEEIVFEYGTSGRR